MQYEKILNNPSVTLAVEDGSSLSFFLFDTSVESSVSFSASSSPFSLEAMHVVVNLLSLDFICSCSELQL